MSLAFLPKLGVQNIKSVNAQMPLPIFLDQGHPLDLLFAQNKLHRMISPENTPGVHAMFFESQTSVHGSIDRDFSDLTLMHLFTGSKGPTFEDVRKKLWRKSLDVRFAVWERPISSSHHQHIIQT